MNKGWVSIHRRLLDHWIWQDDEPFTRRDAWIDLILSANHQGKKFLLGNELVTCERGSFITSEMKLSEKWKWSRTKVRNFLSLLESDKMIAQNKDNKKTYIKICNYDTYQNIETAKDTAHNTAEEQRENSARTSKELHENTNNNVNNDLIMNNNENKREARAKIPVPETLQSFEDPADEAAYQKYKTYMKHDKHRMLTPFQEEEQRLQLRQRKEQAGIRPRETIEHTIACGYMKLVEPESKQQSNGKQQSRYERFADLDKGADEILYGKSD